MEKNLENALKLLASARKYTHPNSMDVINVHPVYIPPSQQMRNQADEYEYREKLSNEIDEFLSNK